MIIFSYHTYPIEARVYIFYIYLLLGWYFYIYYLDNMHKDGRSLYAEIPCNE